MKRPPGGPPQWPVVAGIGAGVIALSLILWIGHRARERLRTEADAMLAASVAGYLTLVTPVDRTGGYHPARLVSEANLLANSTFWGAGLQVAVGSVPLVADTVGLFPLDRELLRAVERGQSLVRARHQRLGRVAIVPLLDRDLWDRVGWVAVWRSVPVERTSDAGFALFAAGLAGLALVVALGGGDVRPAARRAAWAGVAIAAAASALETDDQVRRTAAAATDATLIRARRLVELAASRRGVSLAQLHRVAPGVTITPRSRDGQPRIDGVLRRVEGHEPRAVVFPAVRRRPLELSMVPAEARLHGVRAGLLGAWLLAVGAAGFAGWAARAGTHRRRFRETLTAWGFLGPALAHLAIFSFGPLAFTVYLAFHRWSLVESARPFVGLDNFRQVLGDARFWHSLGVTAAYALYVPVTMALALAAAVALDRSGFRVRALRAVLILPSVSSVVAVALVWQWLYQPDAGLLNAALARLGLPTPDWLGDPRTALPAVMLLSVWVHLGYQTVIFLAGLQSIPASYHDAARVDGAGAWQRFRHVTLPLLRPTILFVLSTGVIASFQVFTFVAVMTEGGPLHATDVVVYRIYREAWEFLRFGTAGAMSLALLVLLFGLTWLQFRWLGRRVDLV
ncbi:MAG TPA: sugar ABC transporter permease [Gemmatimonadales bacterium]|nr:sugar ABC transporter permease [Gemmatimonadales bacterium]